MSEKLMLNDQDIQKIASKFLEFFASKEDIKELNEKIDNLPTKEDFSNLVSSVDSYAHKADGYFQEMLMLAHKVDRLEKWILQIAKKVDIQLTP